jgi:hypothetical protein
MWAKKNGAFFFLSGPFQGGHFLGEEYFIWPHLALNLRPTLHPKGHLFQLGNGRYTQQPL